MKKIYRYEPVGFDLFTDFTVTVAPGTLVVKTQPVGCPRNGTMGHTYIADANTGEFIGLRLLNSLQPVQTKLCNICRVARVPVGVHACEVCE